MILISLIPIQNFSVLLAGDAYKNDSYEKNGVFPSLGRSTGVAKVRKTRRIGLPLGMHLCDFCKIQFFIKSVCLNKHLDDQSSWMSFASQFAL